MKKLILAAGLLFLCFVSKAQQPSNVQMDKARNQLLVEASRIMIIRLNDSIRIAEEAYDVCVSEKNKLLRYYRYKYDDAIKDVVAEQRKYDLTVHVYGKKQGRSKLDEIQTTIDNAKAAEIIDSIKFDSINAHYSCAAISENIKVFKLQLDSLTSIKKVVEEAVNPSPESYVAAWNERETTGKGNSTFSVNIKTLQTFFTNKKTVKQFERSLRDWSRDDYEYTGGGSPEIAYAMGQSGNNRLIFRGTYREVIDVDNYLTYQIEFGLDSVIGTITFRIPERITSDNTSHYISQLVAAGYVIDKPSTRVALAYDNPAIYAVNPHNRVKVRLLSSSDYSTLVTVMKSR